MPECLCSCDAVQQTLVQCMDYSATNSDSHRQLMNTWASTWGWHLPVLTLQQASTAARQEPASLGCFRGVAGGVPCVLLSFWGYFAARLLDRRCVACALRDGSANFVLQSHQKKRHAVFLVYIIIASCPWLDAAAGVLCGLGSTSAACA